MIQWILHAGSSRFAIAAIPSFRPRKIVLLSNFGELFLLSIVSRSACIIVILSGLTREFSV